MSKKRGTCSCCGRYSLLYNNLNASNTTEEVCDECFMAESNNSDVYVPDEDFEFWTKIDWAKQQKFIEINKDLSISCFDSILHETYNNSREVDAPSSTVLFKNTIIGSISWFQPINVNLGWRLVQNFDWMPVGIGFVSNYGWSGFYEKIRERARLLIRYDRSLQNLNARIQTLHKDYAEDGFIRMMPTTWDEIDRFSQCNLRKLLLSEGARIGGGSTSSLKSEQKTVYFDTQSLTVPLIIFAATFLLEYLHFEDFYNIAASNFKE